MSEKTDYAEKLARDILTIQLLETGLVLINQIRKYARENGIVLRDNPSLDILLAKAQNIIYEMDTTSNNIKLADEKKHLFRTDDKGTEPKNRASWGYLHAAPLSQIHLQS